MAIETIPGYPRIGKNRELKKALESFWAGKSPESDLLATATEIRRANREGRYTPLAYQPRLPHGGVALILKNSASRPSAPISGGFLPAGLEQAEEFAIDLGGIMALTDFSVVRNDPAQQLLTLTTCHPKGSAAKRLVVQATLAKGAATPA